MVADFMHYVETLINLYRLSEKLDAAGDTLTRIFEALQEAVKDKKGKSLSESARDEHLQAFKNWVINFDIWGSFLPLTAESWDIHQARAAAYEKLSIFRASLRDFLR